MKATTTKNPKRPHLILPQYPCSHLNCSVLCPVSVAQTQNSIKSFAKRKNDTVNQTDVPIAYAEATGLTYHSENIVSLVGMLPMQLPLHIKNLTCPYYVNASLDFHHCLNSNVSPYCMAV